MEDLINKVHIVPGGQQDGVHHFVHVAVLLLDATQAGITRPSIWQRAAVGVALLGLPCWPGRIPIWCLILVLLLAATACSDSLGTTQTQWALSLVCNGLPSYLNFWSPQCLWRKPTWVSRLVKFYGCFYGEWANVMVKFITINSVVSQ